jgi:hypothetical protein
MINISRTEKIWFLRLRVIDAGRSMLCIAAEVHRRGVAHGMEMLHKEKSTEERHREEMNI